MAQSLHTNSYDEALALPSEESARLALRTQQVIACESGVTHFVDPLGGSYAVERLTDELERRALVYLAKIDELGGMVAAIEQGYVQREIESSAYRYQQEIESKQRVVVGVNAFALAGEKPPVVQRVDSQVEGDQLGRLAAFKRARTETLTRATLAGLAAAARAKDNLLPHIVEAVKAKATVGEIADTLRQAFGEYRPSG